MSRRSTVMLGALLIMFITISSFAGSQPAGDARDKNPSTFTGRFDCKPSEVPDVYGKAFTILSDGVDVCSWEYARKKAYSYARKPVYQDLSNKAGWPDIHVKCGTVAIDPVSRRFKFPEGNTETGIKRVSYTMTPHGMAHRPVIRDRVMLCPNGETWSGIRVVDISNPRKPRDLTTMDVGCFGKESRSLGNRMYSSANYYGVTISDISNPAKPEKVGHWRVAPPAKHSTHVAPFERNGRQYFYCYVVPDGNWKDWPKNPLEPERGLRLVDVTNPAKPVTKNLGLNLMFLAVEGNYAYKAGGNTKIYDVSNPEKPREVGAINAVFVMTVGKRIYAKRGNALVIFDNRNPKAPKEIGSLAGLKNLRGIAVRGKHAYVVTGGNTLTALDVSSPSAIRKLGSGTVSRTKYCADVTLTPDGKVAVVTVEGSGFGYSLFDLSNPGQPKVAGRYYSSGEIQHLLVSGNKATACLEWGGVQAMLDISDPLKMKITGYYHSGQFDNYADAFRGNYIYFGKGQKDVVVDVSDPSNPREVGTYAPEESPFFPVRFWDNTGYSIGTLSGKTVLTTYDYSDPRDPKKIGRCELGGGRYHSLTTDGKLLAAVGKSSLITVDVSKPAAPRVVGKLNDKTVDPNGYYAWQGSGRRLGLRKGYVYGIRGSESADDPRIAVYDVRNPAKPKFVYITPEAKPVFQDDWFDSRILHQGDMFNDLVIDGRYMYVCDYWGGVRVYDLKNATKPVCVDFEFEPYFALVPDTWSRAEYKKVAGEAYKTTKVGGGLHKYFGLTSEKWKKRFEIGNKLSWVPMVYYPGYELFAWNIGELIGDYLCQPKLGGIAVYRIKRSPETPDGKVTIAGPGR